MPLPKQPDVLRDLLIFVAAQFSPDPAGLLAECHGALVRQSALHRRVWIPPETVPALSSAAVRFLAAVEDALRYCVNSQAPADPPTASPAGLEEPLGGVGPRPGVSASSGQGVITLKEAALLLGFRSTEAVRQLVVNHEISGRQEETWRRRWFVSRASVITYGERSRHGSGGTARRSACA